MRKLVLWVLVITVMGAIFYLSHEPAITSGKMSVWITLRLQERLGTTMPFSYDGWNDVHHMIRKSAHFIIYMLLGMCTILALMTAKKSRYHKVTNEISGPNAFPDVSFSVEGLIHCSKYIYEFS